MWLSFFSVYMPSPCICFFPLLSGIQDPGGLEASPYTTLPAPFPSPSFAVWQREGCSLLHQNLQEEFTIPLKYGQPALQLWGQKQLFLNFNLTDSCLPDIPGLTLWATFTLWANLSKTGWRATLLMPQSEVWGLWCDHKLNRAASHFVLCSCSWAQ